MEYAGVITGRFVSRPNRFIAAVEISGVTEMCHVKNTGRCRELLVPGCEVFLAPSQNAARKTKYDLIAVKKGKRLINMDSQAPNTAVYEYLRDTLPADAVIKREVVFGASRIDLYYETAGEKCFVEVKGVTLEENGKTFFPDAPTERGKKHLRELSAIKALGIGAKVFFLIQMENVHSFSPNMLTDPEFGEELKKVRANGVEIAAFDSAVTPSSIKVGKPVEVILP